MEIIEKDINSLIPYEFNNKIHDETQVNRIANSIKEFGFLQPLVIDKNNIVIVGHGRLEGAKKLGLEKVPCLQVENLTEEQIKKYRILDNKLNESERDIESLKVDLEDLGDLNIGDLELDIDDLFPELKDEEEPADVEEDESPEVQKEAKMVSGGDLFQLGNHRLLCGDSTKIEDVEELIDGNKIKMILTDPPYGMNLDTDYSSLKSKLNFKGKFGGKKYEAGKVDDFNPEMLEMIFSINADEIFLRGADYFAEKIPNKNDGSRIVRDKRSNGNDDEREDESSDKMYGSCFELCWSKQKHKRLIARIKRAGIFGMEKEDTKKRMHPTQKPVGLNARFLKKYSDENDSVLDLFGGSGSTLIACEQLNRKCFMMELDPKYVEVIIKRFHNLNSNAEIKCVNRDLDLNQLRDED